MTAALTPELTEPGHLTEISPGGLWINNSWFWRTVSFSLRLSFVHNKNRRVNLEKTKKGILGIPVSCIQEAPLQPRHFCDSTQQSIINCWNFLLQTRSVNYRSAWTSIKSSPSYLLLLSRSVIREVGSSHLVTARRCMWTSDTRPTLHTELLLLVQNESDWVLHLSVSSQCCSDSPPFCLRRK